MFRWIYEVFYVIFKFALSVYYRNIEVKGTEHIPLQGPFILAANHPNGIVDPVLIAAHCTREVGFVVKDSLFRQPVLGCMLRNVHAIPVHRRGDPTTTLASNMDAFRGMYDRLGDGEGFMIFPEGTSHSESQLQELRSGFARAAVGALRGRPTLPEVVIVPVGINYVEKDKYRSDVFLEFGEPLVLLREIVERCTSDEDDQILIQDLKNQLEGAITNLVLTAPSWRDIRIMSLARDLYTEDQSDPSPSGYFSSLRWFVTNYQRLLTEKNANAVELADEIEEYESTLSILRLIDRDVVSLSTTSGVCSLVLKTILSLVIILPFSLPGHLFHLPVAFIANLAANKLAEGERDQIVHYKIIVGVLLVPILHLTLFLCVTIFVSLSGAIVVAFFALTSGLVASLIQPLKLTVGSFKKLCQLTLFDAKELRQRRSDIKIKVHKVVRMFSSLSSPEEMRDSSVFPTQSCRIDQSVNPSPSCLDPSHSVKGEDVLSQHDFDFDPFLNRPERIPSLLMPGSGETSLVHRSASVGSPTSPATPLVLRRSVYRSARSSSLFPSDVESVPLISREGSEIDVEDDA